MVLCYDEDLLSVIRDISNNHSTKNLIKKQQYLHLKL
jgi:hypothetical protein